MMKLTLMLATIVMMTASGCATMGMGSSYKAEGPVSPALLDGPVAFDFKDPAAAGKTLVRGKLMYMAGAEVQAHLQTTPGRKLAYLVDAQRTRETTETMQAKFTGIEKLANDDSLCFSAVLVHSTINLAKASAWRLKASLDDGEWIPLRPIGRDGVPSFVVSNGKTEWIGSGYYCAEAKGWLALKKSIRLQVFPPVYVNPGETTLTWSLAANAPKP